MYNTTITPVELGLSCIVLIGYIVGKVWMYYKIEGTNDKENNKQDREGFKVQAPKRERGIAYPINRIWHPNTMDTKF